MTNQRERRWTPIFSTPIAGKTAVVIGFGDLGQGAGRAAKKLGLQVLAVTRSGKAGAPGGRRVSRSRASTACCRKAIS